MRYLVAALLVAALASCSTDESPPSNSPELGGTVGVPSVDPPASAPPAPVDLGTVPDPAGPADTGLGSCRVTVTGDLKAEWAVDATVESVTYGPWLSDEALAAAAENSVVIDASFLVLNCRASGAQSVSITAADPVPQRAATYRLSYDAEGTVPSPRNRFDVVVSLDDAGLCRLAGDGVVDITMFDDDRIAGAFEAVVRCADGATLYAVGRFDFVNPEPFLTPPQD